MSASCGKHKRSLRVSWCQINRLPARLSSGKNINLRVFRSHGSIFSVTSHCVFCGIGRFRIYPREWKFENKILIYFVRKGYANSHRFFRVSSQTHVVSPTAIATRHFRYHQIGLLAIGLLTIQIHLALADKYYFLLF